LQNILSDQSSRRLFYWMAAGRLALFSLLSGGAYILSHRFGGPSYDGVRVSLFIVGAFFLTGLYVLWYKRGFLRKCLIWTQVLVDILMVNLAVFWTGGLATPFAFLYPLAIVNACLFEGRRGGALAALVSTISYASVCWWIWDPRTAVDEAAYIFFINMAAFNLTGALGIVLAQRLRRTEIRLSEAEVDLRRMEEVHRNVAKSLRSGLITVDEKGEITSVNHAAAEILGIKLPRRYGIQLAAIWPAGAEIVADREISRRGDRQEIIHVMPNGQQRFLGISPFPLADDEGDLLGYGMIFQDITEIKAKEERMQRTDRLAALGEMAAGLAHEIRNPLASISGAAQFLEEAQLLLPEGERLLQIITRESRRLNDLTKTFLLYAKPEGRRNEKISLRREMEYVLSLLRQRKGFSKATVETHIPKDLELQVDPDQFRQAALNLVLNAYQALPQEGGTIVLRAEGEQRRVILIISDNGSGISEEDLGKIFNPFFTTRHDGTGLGLAIVHRLVNAWGGDIVVESKRNTGTTFTLRLPKESGQRT
jgi:two-component system sensor histidine kinase PilS (NtrC family)